MQATAALPEAVTTERVEAGSTPAAGVPIDADVRAFIDEVSQRPDQTFPSKEAMLSAQNAGSLTPGDTLVVAGEVYIVLRDGSAKKIGSVGK